MTSPTTTRSPAGGAVGALCRQYPLIGLALQHHRSTRGLPMSFQACPYAVEWYADALEGDGFDIMSAVQVFKTEFLIQLAFERAGWSGRTVAYVLPKFAQRDKFVQSRVNPLLLGVPAYRRRLPPRGRTLSGADEDSNEVGSLALKRFGRGLLRFIGSNAATEFVEFAADVLIVDEVDHCDTANLELARDRLRSSPYPQVFRVGNPTIGGVGISRIYEQGDQRRWNVECPHCGRRQPLDWFTGFVRQAEDGAWLPRDEERAVDPSTGDLRPVCTGCRRAFDRPIRGVWVAGNPGAWRRSYQVSRLDVLTVDVRSLYHEWRVAQGDSAKLQTFYTSVLGRPYEAAGAKVTVSDLDRAAVAPDTVSFDALGSSRVVAGIDVGARLHVHIDVVEHLPVGPEPAEGEPDTRLRVRQRRGVFVGTVPGFEEARDLLVRYRVDVAVVDSLPETHKAQELRDEMNAHGCRVWLCRYAQTERIGSQAYGMACTWESRAVVVDRTQLLDACLDDLRSGGPVASRTFPRGVFSVPNWSREMTAAMRVLDKKGRRYVWDNGDKADHYSHADAYSRVAADILDTGGFYLVV